MMPKFLRKYSTGTFDLSNKSVLVTGATGSFGHAFVKHAIENLNVERLVVFSRDELKQYEMQQLYPFEKYPQLRFFIGDIRDRERLKSAMKGVNYVVHAAALKHVTAMEYNPFECVQTNIHGAENIVRAAIECGVEKVVALSTDKAAEPVNLYGASKLVSDKIFTAANNLTGKNACKFSVVRYGNVANSRGSVIPFFRKLVNEGHSSLPITDERMTRFIMTIDQGVDLVCLGLDVMEGGEMWIPKAPSIRITDLAEAILPGCEKHVVGIRPGEKIHECLVPSASSRLVREAESFYMVQPELLHQEYQPPRKFSWKSVETDFEYDSGTNPEFLSVSQIKELLEVL